MMEYSRLVLGLCCLCFTLTRIRGLLPRRHCSPLPCPLLHQRLPPSCPLLQLLCSPSSPFNFNPQLWSQAQVHSSTLFPQHLVHSLLCRCSQKPALTYSGSTAVDQLPTVIDGLSPLAAADSASSVPCGIVVEVTVKPEQQPLGLLTRHTASTDSQSMPAQLQPWSAKLRSSSRTGPFKISPVWNAVCSEL